MTHKIGTETSSQSQLSGSLETRDQIAPEVIAVLNWLVNLTRGKSRPFKRGLFAGAGVFATLFMYSTVSLIEKDPHWIEPGYRYILGKIVEPDLFSKKVYVRLVDTTEVPSKRVVVRELTIHGSQNLTGTYRNTWNGNTGRLVGFKNGEVVEMAFVEDPDDNGQPRHGIGSWKFERVPSDDAKEAAIYVGHEEGCNCSANETTSVSAVLSESADPPSWVTDVTDRKKTIVVDFARPIDVTNYRTKQIADASR